MYVEEESPRSRLRDVTKRRDPPCLGMTLALSRSIREFACSSRLSTIREVSALTVRPVLLESDTVALKVDYGANRPEKPNERIGGGEGVEILKNHGVAYLRRQPRTSWRRCGARVILSRSEESRRGMRFG